MAAFTDFRDVDSSGRNGAIDVRPESDFCRDAEDRGGFADVQVATQFVAPNAGDNGRLDLASVAGVIGFVRTREDAEVPTIFISAVDDHGAAMAREPGENVDGLLRDFVTGRMPKLSVSRISSRVIHQFSGGPLGDAGRVSCFVLRHMPSLASRFRCAGNTEAQVNCGVTLAVRELRFDLLLHRSLQEADPVKFGFSTDGTPWDLLPTLTVAQSCLGPATPFDPADDPGFCNDDRFADAVRYAAQSCGWSLGDFRGLRVVLRFPPPGSTLTASYPFCDAP